MMIATGSDRKRRVLWERVLWFSLGVLVAILHNQLTWRKSGPTRVYIQPQVPQQQTDREEEEMQRMLDELNKLRKDVKRMKMSKDMVKEQLSSCEEKLLQAQQQQGQH